MIAVSNSDLNGKEVNFVSDVFISLVASVAGGVAANYITKWLDSKLNRKQ